MSQQNEVEVLESPKKTQIQKQKQDNVYTDFIKSKLQIKDVQIQAKVVTHGRFYRVNFYKYVDKNIDDGRNLFRTYSMIDSKFVEIINNNGILDLIDRTILPDKKS